MKFFVTGASGFVGSAVVAEAIARGHQVVATLRTVRTIDRRLERATIEQLDLRDAEALKIALGRHRPEIIVNTAWSGVANRTRNDRAQIDDNIAASCNLAEAAAEHGVRKFVGIGSQAEYGALDGRISETAASIPTSLYGAAKLATMILTRQMAARSNMAFTWLRLFATYGPGDSAFWLIPSTIEEMLKGRSPQMTTGAQLWDYLYIDDVARGIVAASDGEAEGVFNLGSGRPVAVRTIVEMLRKEIAPALPVEFGSRPHPVDQIWHMEADIDALTSATGWTPQVDLESGLSRTVAWHRLAQGQRP